ncbi:MAG: hypothetical protein HFE45_00685 [Oscillospiraceae bacterium]|jgi:hypothetical protein|nr:hypothetical protein [Oscillospiraceae bacterium]
MRLIGMVMLFLCCTGGGFWLSGRLAGRVRRLESAEQLLTETIGMVRNQNLPTWEILSRLKDEGYFTDVSNADAAFGGFAADPLFRPAERVVLVRSGQLLGASDRESQAARLELELSALRRMRSDAEEERAVKGKLFRSMGLLLGSLAVVLAI